MVKDTGTRNEAHLVVLHGKIVDRREDKASGTCTLPTLAHEVDKRDKLMREVPTVAVPTAMVRARSDEQPLAVVKLVLAIDVQAEAPRPLGELANPRNLLAASEDSSVHIKGSRAQGHMKE